MQNLWDIIWIVICIHVLAVYLMVVFRFLTDLFHTPVLSGWVKAIWIIALIFVPFLTALIYLITRGQQTAIRQAAGAKSAAPSIADIKALRDSGAITQAEFDILKGKCLIPSS